MRPLHALALAMLCISTASAQSPGDKSAAPGATGVTTTQAAPLAAGTAVMVEASGQQAQGTVEPRKDSRWRSLWLWSLLGVGGTIVCVVPYLVVVHLVFKTGLSIKRDGIL
ncbi:MAG TPA: hypothetical protein VJK49_00710 [Candidatus Limnocylindrales bacterium]|nr:hypothetical protein [Candidatus Limnocylindrales bacterium]